MRINPRYKNLIFQVSLRGVAAKVLCVLMVFASTSIYSQVEVKFNAATALLLIPNAGIELQLDERKSIQLDVLGSFWDSMPLLNDTPLHITQTFLEYRFYTGESLNNWFIGPHIGFGMFTLEKPNYLILYDYYEEAAGGSSGGGFPKGDAYQSGRAAFYGLTVGYKKRLNALWSMEAFLGFGLSQSKYRGYKGYDRVDHLQDPPDGPFNGSGEVLLYRGGLMFVYKLFNVNNSI